MKSIQVMSSFFFLLITIPALLFLSQRDREKIPEEVKALDSIEYQFQDEDGTMHSAQASATDFSMQFPILKECADIVDLFKQNKCTEGKLLNILRNSAIFTAMQSRLKGIMTLTFLVDSIGSIQNVAVYGEFTENYGNSMAIAFEKVLDKLHFVSGKYHGKNINTRLSIPLTLPAS